MSTIPGRLRELRESFNLTQSEVGKYLGITGSGYGYYETGRNEISIEHMRLLAKKYEVSVSYILGETDSKPESFNKKKDERDVVKRMLQLNNDLLLKKDLSFDEEPLNEETKEFLIEMIEFSIKLARKMNKKHISTKNNDNK